MLDQSVLLSQVSPFAVGLVAVRYSGSAVVPKEVMGAWRGLCSWPSRRHALSSRTYRLTYRLRLTGKPCVGGRTGDLTGKFTSRFPEVTASTTLASAGSANRICCPARYPSSSGIPCFAQSRRLAPRPGRIMPPPQVSFPGSFATTSYGGTSCIPPLSSRNDFCTGTDPHR